jgi:hypothetical protein
VPNKTAWWVGIMFLTNVFFIPFLALRAAPEPEDGASGSGTSGSGSSGQQGQGQQGQQGLPEQQGQQGQQGQRGLQEQPGFLITSSRHRQSPGRCCPSCPCPYCCPR